MPIIYRIDASATRPLGESRAIRHAAEVLRRGGLVAFPTETVYGLGANALDAAAVRAIFAAKGRPANNPLIVHVGRIEQARQLAAAWPADADRLAAEFWPGPLSLVVPRGPLVPDVVTAGAATVALRIPLHPVARALLEATELPVAAPSANRSNQISPTLAEHVLRGLEGAVDIVLDGGATSGGLESTVLDLSTDPPRILRPGLIRPSQIERVVGPIQCPELSIADSPSALPSPGTQRRHYAPRALVECCADSGRSRVESLCEQGIRIGWMAMARVSTEPPAGAVVIEMPMDSTAYSARLYAAMHELDAAGVERIVVDLPPSEEAWQAIRDRLQRAAAQ